MSRISPASRPWAKSGAKVRRLFGTTKFFNDFFQKNFPEGDTPYYIKGLDREVARKMGEKREILNGDGH